MEDRFRTLHNALDIAVICSTFDGWFFVNDIHALYQDEISAACRRTISRYLFALSNAGLLEAKRDRVVVNAEGGASLKYQFKWVGWPTRDISRKTEIIPNPFSRRKAK